MTTNNTTNIAVRAYAVAAWVNEYNAHEGMYPTETPETYFHRLDEARRVEALAADKVEELTGSRPEFVDQGGFMDGCGVIVFGFNGIEFEFDGKNLSIC